MRIGRWQRRVLIGSALLVLLVLGGGVAANRIPSFGHFLRTREPTRSLIVWIRGLRRGTHAPGRMGDGSPLERIQLVQPMGLAIAPDGRLWIGDRVGLLWRVDRAGIARVVAGNGSNGVPRFDRPACESELGSPQGIAFGPDGRAYFADSDNHMILALEPGGRLVHVAGTGLRGYGGDGGPATQARFHEPHDICFDASGNLYVADALNHRIRRIGRDGIITTVAGTGEAGYSGDGGPATAARLYRPYSVAVDAGGGLLVADSYNNVIRRIASDGVIRTVAGVGEQGLAGDGGPAIRARFNAPQALAPLPNGSFYVSDEHNHCIRRITIDGEVRTVLGIGEPGCGSDRLPPTAMALDDPEEICLRPDGGLLVSDKNNRRVLVLIDGRVRTVAGQGADSGKTR